MIMTLSHLLMLKVSLNWSTDQGNHISNQIKFKNFLELLVNYSQEFSFLT